MTLPYSYAFAACIPLIAVAVAVGACVLDSGWWVLVSAVTIIVAVGATIVIDLHIEDLTNHADIGVGVAAQVIVGIVAVVAWCIALEENS